ncbi:MULTISPECIES: vitamin K epoxide reductase family protein [unclassified Mucilaginibacter]|uniref:vitamin K epoxide reductase family protein n=1 Tax=unclassified Mucilaginibacter TaxID=2617802 RepID=UPI002AC9A279|nr:MULTISPECIES: vitamin K epoxide reductase family protein [unclassified Mucilaginibacter]MEB0280872.1 vitamin K epoxide reductase family protein [Mucilaginibacter sp. 10B2]MEB0302747.1 vitamin K epoxide reductase family protein [Mucilaginibacter sp. 5C4]WPX25645.1 vitamin K epoxide reductase family protein [Mucilaginibacter sp. 5C4]
MVSLKVLPNCESTVIRLLQSLDINPDPQTIIDEFLKHPHYPSLFAIADVFKTFEIESYTFKCEVDELDNIEVPFLALTNLNDEELVLVRKITPSHLYLYKNESGSYKIKKSDFETIYKGIVLIAEPTELTKRSSKIIQFLQKIKIPGIISLLALFFISSLLLYSDLLAVINIRITFLVLAKTGGLFVAILLLIQSINSLNPLITKLCKSGKKTDCNMILTSDAAKVFGTLSWSDVGFFYFSGTFLAILLSPSDFTFNILKVLNFIALPYTFYSIYFQAFIAKKWCLFCCAVQAIIWLEFLCLVTGNPLLPHFKNAEALTLKSANLLVMCLIIPACLWLLIKPALLKIQTLNDLRYQLRHFKYNIEFFTKMLMNEPKYADPDKSVTINLGNPEALLKFTVITAPYCRHCSDAHLNIDEFLKGRDDVNFSIVLMADNTDDGKSNIVCRHLIALNQQPNKALVKDALRDWYAQPYKNYKAWAARHPISWDESASAVLQQHWDWCRMVEAQGTPTVLLNGHMMPKNYLFPDLKYLFN